MFGRFNIISNSSNSDYSFSVINKISSIDFSSITESKPDVILYSDNNEDIYYLDSSRNVKSLNIQTGSINNTGKIINSGEIKVSDKYIIAGNRYIYDRNNFSLLSDLNTTDRININWDNEIYVLKTDTNNITIYNLKDDMSLELSIEVPKPETTCYLRIISIDNDNDIFKFIYSNGSNLYYCEYEISTKTSLIKKELTASPSGTHSLFRSGKEIYVSRQRDSSYTYTYSENKNGEQTLLYGFAYDILENTPYIAYSKRNGTNSKGHLIFNNNYGIPNSLKIDVPINGIGGKIIVSEASTNKLDFYIF